MTERILANHGSGIPPKAQRWMLFVDGENLTIRAQQLLCAKEGGPLVAGPCYRKDTFVWVQLPGTFNLANPTIPLQSHALRAYYYTSLVSDVDTRRAVSEALKELGFTPRVFPRLRGQVKAKGVDISLATDLLGHAFRDHFDAALLIAGDGDYVPLVEEVKRIGKLVYVAFLANHGLSPELKLSADEFFDMEWMLRDFWQNKIEGLLSTLAPPISRHS